MFVHKKIFMFNYFFIHKKKIMSGFLDINLCLGKIEKKRYVERSENSIPKTLQQSAENVSGEILEKLPLF